MNQDSIQSILLSGGSIALGFLIKLAWERFRKDSEGLESKVDKLDDTLNKTIIAVTKLEVKLEGLDDKLDLIGKMRIDIADLGNKVRSMDKNS